MTTARAEPAGASLSLGVIVEKPGGKSSRPSPFSLRLTEAERGRLLNDAGGEPLGTYIKAQLFSADPVRRRGPSLADREAFAKVLALLGRSHLANNLNQLAKAVNSGSLPVTPETESELSDALKAVRELRALLMQALGLTAGASV